MTHSHVIKDCPIRLRTISFLRLKYPFLLSLQWPINELDLIGAHSALSSPNLLLRLLILRIIHSVAIHNPAPNLLNQFISEISSCLIPKFLNHLKKHNSPTATPTEPRPSIHFPSLQHYAFFDGSAFLDPKVSGAGAVLFNAGTEVCCIGKRLIYGTITTAECMGLELAIDLAIARDIERISIYGDSQVIINCFSSPFCSIPSIIKDYIRIRKKMARFKHINLQYIPREYNKRANVIAFSAATSEECLLRSYTPNLLIRPTSPISNSFPNELDLSEFYIKKFKHPYCPLPIINFSPSTKSLLSSAGLITASEFHQAGF